MKLVTSTVEELRAKGVQEGELYFSNFFSLGVGEHPAEMEPAGREGRRAVSMPMWGGGVWGGVGEGSELLRGSGRGGVDAVGVGVGVGGSGVDGSGSGLSGSGSGLHRSGIAANGLNGSPEPAVGTAHVASGKEVKLRQCVRCTAVMEDVLQERGRGGGVQWVFNLQRMCFCGGFWVV